MATLRERGVRGAVRPSGRARRARPTSDTRRAIPHREMRPRSDRTRETAPSEGERAVSIQKRGQAYVVRWRRDGRQHARSFVRKADAQAFELEQRRAGQMGAFAAAAPSRQTLDTLLDEWWASRSILWAASTREHREQALKRWIRPYVGGVQLRDLGRRRVEEWRAVIVQDGAKPRTANHALGVLSAALTAAVDANRIPANPCYGVRPVPEGKPQRRALTPDEVERICAAMPQAARPRRRHRDGIRRIAPRRDVGAAMGRRRRASDPRRPQAGRTTSSATRRPGGRGRSSSSGRCAKTSTRYDRGEPNRARWSFPARPAGTSTCTTGGGESGRPRAPGPA